MAKSTSTMLALLGRDRVRSETRWVRWEIRPWKITLGMTTGLTEVGWLTGWRLIPVSTVNTFVRQFGEFTAATKKLAEGIKLTGHQDAGLHAGLALGVCVVVGSGILTLGSLGHAHLTSRATRAAAKQAAQTAQAQKQAQEQQQPLQQIQQAQEQIQEQRRSLQQIQQAHEQIQEQLQQQLRQQLQQHAPAQTQDKVRRILQLSDEQQERLLKLVEETRPASRQGGGVLGGNPAAGGSDGGRR